MITKIELREKAKEIRKTLDISEISTKIVESLKTSEIYQVASHIMIFYPLNHEINLLPLLEDSEKNFYLPKIQGEELLVCPYKKGDELTTSKFGSQEPKTEAINPDILELLFLPALMVDKNFNRLGYGKGFYDRFLLKNALTAIRIVPISSQLIIDELPTNEFDVQFDVIVDEL